MAIRRLTIGDEDLLRAVRIRALTDAPERFGSTIERERARTVEDRRRWFTPGATFVFEAAGGEVVGLVAVVRPTGEPALAQLISMWVDPEARGLGVADALVQAMLAFAVDDGAALARVHVYDTNDRAIRLYERHGFVRSGLVLGPDALGRVEAELLRPLAADPGTAAAAGRR